MKTELLYHSKGMPTWIKILSVIMVPLDLLLAIFFFALHEFTKQAYSYQIGGLYISTGNTGGAALLLGWLFCICFGIFLTALIYLRNYHISIYSDHIEGFGKVSAFKAQPFRYQISEIRSVAKVSINLMVTLQNNTTCTVVCQDAQKACQILQQLLITAQTPAQQ